MQFCTHHSRDLNAAFASLLASPSNDAARNPPGYLTLTNLPPEPSTLLSSVELQDLPRLNHDPPPPKEKGKDPQARPPTTELSTLLLSLRKLREAILITDSKTPVPFAQRVHIFSIRLSILSRHPPSYFPSLNRLLNGLSSPSQPLAISELIEFTTYLILDYACRQNDMAAAYELRQQARTKHAFASEIVDCVLSALAHDNWVAFWRARKEADGYIRAIMNWAAERIRRTALKAVGSAYLTADADWIVHGCTGEEDMTWDNLVETERLGWKKEGDRIIIRKLKPKTQKDEKLERAETVLRPIKEDG
jgi:hypothetical protein